MQQTLKIYDRDSHLTACEATEYDYKLSSFEELAEIF